MAKDFVRNEGGTLVAEVVFLEVFGDRNSDYILGHLMRAEEKCRKENACLLYVEFWSESHWRRHNRLIDALCDVKSKGIEVVPLYPDCVTIDGKSFDPLDHFRAWDRTINPAESKRRRVQAEDAIKRLARHHPLGEGRYKSIAIELNREGVPTPSGRIRWSPENVRAFMRRREIK